MTPDPDYTLGHYLKEVRDSRGITLEEISEKTKIKLSILEALEKDDLTGLPSPVYVKGFLKLTADYLGIDRAELLNRFDPGFDSLDKKKIFLLQPKGSLVTKSKSPFTATFIKYAFMTAAAAAAVLLLVWLFSLLPDKPKKTADHKPPPPSVKRTIKTKEKQAVPASVSFKPVTYPAITTERLTLKASVSKTLWARIKSDGSIVFEGMLEHGDTKAIEASETFEIKLGNAGAVTFTLNGTELGFLGGQGEVLDIVIDRTGIRKG